MGSIARRVKVVATVTVVLMSAMLGEKYAPDSIRSEDSGSPGVPIQLS